MTGKQRILVLVCFLASFAALFLVLKAAGSSHQLVDNLSSLIGILTSVLTMFIALGIVASIKGHYIKRAFNRSPYSD